MDRTNIFNFDDDHGNTMVRNCCNCKKSMRHRRRILRSPANPTSLNPTSPFVQPFVFGSPVSSSPSSISSNIGPVYTSPSTDFQFQASSSSSLEKEFKTTSSKIGDSDSTKTKAGNVKQKAEESKPLQLTLVSKTLKGIPQSPHFYQLRNYSKMVRKNLISGWDRIFEETVEGIHSLQMKDFWVRAKEMWKTMEELQSLGYNVILLRRRLVELTDVMMGMKSSENVIVGLRNKAEFHRMEKSRLEFEILKLQGKVESEEESVVELFNMVVEMEMELPKFDVVFEKLAMKSL